VVTKHIFNSIEFKSIEIATILSVPFCLYHFVQYHFVRSPFLSSVVQIQCYNLKQHLKKSTYGQLFKDEEFLQMVFKRKT